MPASPRAVAPPPSPPRAPATFSLDIIAADRGQSARIHRAPGSALIGESAASAANTAPTPVIGRPSIQVWFRCANRYQRVFRAVDGSGYAARCPLCGKTMQFRVGPAGIATRTFEVSC
jgi:hypothetical protein